MCLCMHAWTDGGGRTFVPIFVGVAEDIKFCCIILPVHVCVQHYASGIYHFHCLGLICTAVANTSPYHVLCRTLSVDVQTRYCNLQSRRQSTIDVWCQ